MIREVFFLEWLANTVVVKKKNGKWRVGVDFMDLNWACPKDPFPMPKIDQLVDATYGHSRMSFLDAFQGYHQIALAPKDREKVEMLLFLLQKIDVFAWSPYEVSGVDPEFIVHKLNVDPSFLPKKQKPRRASKEHVDAVNLEV